MIQHPLPPHIISTPLNQLPLASSQISSQIIKRQLEMKKFLLSNINVGLEFYRKNQKLLDALTQSNQISLTSWRINKQNYVPEQQITLQESRTTQDKCRSALRLSNLDELARHFDTLPEQMQEILALQAASQLPTPNLQNAPKIISLLQKIFLNQTLKFEIKENVLKQSFKTLIQKSLKMKLDVKAYSTNRNLKHYYFDIAQIYQKSFNKTMKILVKSIDESLQGTISQIITNTFNQFRINFLGLLQTTRSEEKTLYFLVGQREPLKNKDFLLQESRLHCTSTLKSQLINEIVGKITSRYLLKLDSDTSLKEWFENEGDQREYDFDEYIKPNREMLEYLFEDRIISQQQDNGRLQKEIIKQLLSH